MSYKGIVGHAAAAARLRALVRRGRVAHAYLFSGPAGVGKRLVAAAFARSLLCEARGDEACGACAACRKPAHPDLRIVRRDPDRKELLIEQVREVIRELAFASRTARVVIVEEAERLNEEAQNAFLKTLEEAPDRAVLILVTSAASMILPTIRSRCQSVLFFGLSEEEIVEILRQDTPEARLAAALAEGSAGRAAELLEDLREWGPESAELLGKVFAGDLNSIVEGMTKFRDNQKARQRAIRILQIVATAVREALRARANAPIPGRTALSRLAEGLDVEELAARLESLIDHQLMIERNANVSLVLENALLRL